jgi:hypothetical protein
MRTLRGARRVAVIAILAVPLALIHSSPIVAQPNAPGSESTPANDSVQARVEAVAGAFGAIVESADIAVWQDADVAYNSALDALDLHRPFLEEALGDPARAAFRRIDELVLTLVDALDAEDLARLRVAATLIEQELVTLVPGGPPDEPGAEAAQVIIQWRSARDTILALAEVGGWRDMRNAAMDLTDDIVRRGPVIVEAAGHDSQAEVDLARVFAMRLRAAALDQSLVDGRTAAGVFSDALDALAQRVGLAPTPRPPAGESSRLRFRAYEVRASDSGDVVTMPIVAEDIPQIGLGAMDLAARWSPNALRLIDVTWEVAEGSVARDDTAGSVVLTLPAAPTGPSGNAVIGQLVFEVLDGSVAGEDYLPAVGVESIEAAIRDARKLVRQGDTPRASAVLADAYVAFRRGADTPGGLHALLDAHGLAAPLAASLLAALDAASRPAETDVILLALAALRRNADAAWAGYLGALSQPGGVPVVLDALSAHDTTGAPLPVAEVLPGQVLLPEMSTRAPAGKPTPGRPTVPPQLVETAAVAEPTGPAIAAPADAGGDARAGEGPSAAASAGPGFPLPLVIALAIAAVLGAAAVLLADRNAPQPPDG